MGTSNKLFNSTWETTLVLFNTLSLIVFAILFSACPLPPKPATISFNLENGNYNSPQVLKIIYNPMGSETASIVYTFTTDGSEPADPSDSASNPINYTVGIPILAETESQYHIRVIVRSAGKTIAELAGNFRRGDIDGDKVFDSTDLDDDNNGLIEIRSLTMLHNMRYNLAGTSYDSTDDGDTPMTGEGEAMEANPGITTGAPTTATTNCNTGLDFDADPSTPPTFLCGYELTADLTFDTDEEGDGTWTNTGTADAPTFTLDSGDSTNPYFVVTTSADGSTSGGWIPIGDISDRFVAIFDGNGHTITGLASISEEKYIGFFGYLGEGAIIRNIGLVDNLANYSGMSNATNYVGGLAAYVRGTIVASYSTGQADGGAGSSDYVAALVGQLHGGSVVASFATGKAHGGVGTNYGDIVGGLVGHFVDGQIVASFATGNVGVGEGSLNHVGGLVGSQDAGSIIASYASASLNDGGSGGNRIGGLVGTLGGGILLANYASNLTESGTEAGLRVSSLVGRKFDGSIIASFGFTKNGSLAPSTSSTSITNNLWLNLTEEQRNLHMLNLAIANNPDGSDSNRNTWNSSARGSLNAWNFGVKTRKAGGPTLNFADYDGERSSVRMGDFPILFHCEGRTNPPKGAILIPNCGNLIPRQR